MSARLAKRQLVEPDFLTGPKYVETYGPEVAELCAKADFAPDPQQELALDRIFAITPHGTCASFGFCIICCRQNLKTGLFKQAALGWLYVTEVDLVVWSAHEMPTTREAHRELGELIRDTPILRKRLKDTPNEGIYDANGEERIELRTGQRILFKARTISGGRGLSGDKVILDEAFALKPSHVGSLLPTMTARPDPQVLYGSSAGKADSTVLHDLRDRGRAGSSRRLTYLEWSAPKRDCADSECTHPKSGAEGCALDDEDLYRKANPTLTTGRISLQTIRDMRQELPPEEFMRECLGWWDELEAEVEPAFGRVGAWEDCSVPPGEPPDEGLAIGVAVSIDGSWSSIGAASQWPDEDRLHLGANERRRGTRWLFDVLKDLQDRRGCPVVIDGGGPASFLIEPLQLHGVNVTVASMGDVLEACASLYRRVNDGSVTHMHYSELDDAVAGAKQRKVGDRWAWGRRTSLSDVSMLEAVTLASHFVGQYDGFNVW